MVTVIELASREWAILLLMVFRALFLSLLVTSQK